MAIVMTELPPRPVVWRTMQERSDLYGNAKRVFLWLFDYQTKLQKSGRFQGLFPFYATMARSLGISRRTAMRAVDRLRDLGLLEVIAPAAQDTRRSNRYVLQWPQEAQLPSEAPAIANDDSRREVAPPRDTLTEPLEQTVTEESSYPQPSTLVPQAITVPDPEPETKIPLRTQNTIQQPLVSTDDSPVSDQPGVVLSPPAFLNSNSSTPDTIPEQLTLIPHKVLGRWQTQFHASLDVIIQWIDWGRAAPVSHPARPKDLTAWVTAALRDGWTMPPSWIVPESKPTVRIAWVVRRCAQCGFELATQDTRALEPMACTYYGCTGMLSPAS